MTLEKQTLPNFNLDANGCDVESLKRMSESSPPLVRVLGASFLFVQADVNMQKQNALRQAKQPQVKYTWLLDSGTLSENATSRKVDASGCCNSQLQD